ncbi:FAD:protein FMN transferase [Croceicoccus estronivorus]|uniref:FAD:protein FMN transferase n=1 Tax=Croceicoccus estronivorus TaxID=1172626 RepID=UPI000AFB17B1|nr:FAD:protein FMN transferase [Croceicoccus estronivorus]
MRDAPAKGEVARLGGRTMGTTWSALAALAAPEQSNVLTRAIQAALDRVVAEMSQWERDSDLSRFNRALAGSWHMLPPNFAKVIDEALAMARLSDGAFDPTLGRVTEIWGFGAKAIQSLPNDAAITDALAASGWDKLDFDSGKARLRQPGGLHLDLSGIAKGFGADQAAAVLRNAGIGAFLLDVGGELVGQGVKPDGQPWWVALEDPPGATLPPFRAALYNMAIATSGNYRRFHDIGGARVSHSLDPRTGRPLCNNVVSVSVLTASAMRADALATALTALGDRAGEFARRHDIAARIIRSSDGGHSEEITPTLAAMLE